MNVVLFSTNCPKCKVLVKKLDKANIKYQTVTDVKVMLDKGFMSAPMLEVDGEVMDFSQANNWINEQE